MARRLYTLAVLLLLPFALLHLLWRSRRQPEYLRHWGERLGRYGSRGSSVAPVIWIHAVSVGETRAAQPLLSLLRARHPAHAIVFSHTTPTGRATSLEIYGDRVGRLYLPYDTPGALRRFLAHLNPVVGVIMETEIWPNLVAACRQRNIPLLLVNARLSARSARRYALLPGLTRGALQGFAAVAAQTEEDGRRLEALGAERVTVSGNLKFDSSPARELIERGRAWRSAWREVTGRRVLLAASTREGEEALILDALRRNPIEQLLLVIVPRHPQRFDAVAELATKLGVKLQRRSSDQPLAAQTQLWLGDSMGEMPAYYAAADLAVIGGSLLPYGSQNLIEACAAATTLLIGPSTFNFAWAAEAALACGAARTVADADALVSVAKALLADAQQRLAMAEAGRDFASRHRGASERTLAILESHLPPAEGGVAASSLRQAAY